MTGFSSHGDIMVASSAAMLWLPRTWPLILILFHRQLQKNCQLVSEYFGSLSDASSRQGRASNTHSGPESSASGVMTAAKSDTIDQQVGCAYINKSYLTWQLWCLHIKSVSFVKYASNLHRCVVSQDVLVAAVLAECTYRAVDVGEAMAAQAARLLEKRLLGRDGVLERMVWSSKGPQRYDEICSRAAGEVHVFLPG